MCHKHARHCLEVMERQLHMLGQGPRVPSRRYVWQGYKIQLLSAADAWHGYYSSFQCETHGTEKQRLCCKWWRSGSAASDGAAALLQVMAQRHCCQWWRSGPAAGDTGWNQIHQNMNNLTLFTQLFCEKKWIIIVVLWHGWVIRLPRRSSDCVLTNQITFVSGSMSCFK